MYLSELRHVDWQYNEESLHEKTEKIRCVLSVGCTECSRRLGRRTRAEHNQPLSWTD